MLQDMGSLSYLAPTTSQSDQAGVCPESTASHRRRSLRVLFVHRDADAIDSCVQELEKAQFIVNGDVVLNLAQCTESLQSQTFDVVVAEYPSPSWKGSQSLKRL